MLNSIAQLSTKLMDRVRPMKPPPIATMQPEPIENMLPYETFLEIDERTFVLLSDGSLGVVWELAPIQHEIADIPLLTAQIQAFVRVLESVTERNMTFQLIWDSTPSKAFDLPEYADNPKTFAQEIMCERIRAIQGKADKIHDGLACMRRRLYLCLRMQSEGRLGLDDSHKGFFSGSATSALEKQTDRLSKAQEQLIAHCRTLEDGLNNAGLGWRRCNATGFVQLVRGAVHSYAYARDHAAFWSECNPEERISSQVSLDFIEMSAWGIQLGCSETSEPDTVQVLSWGQQPAKVYYGMLAHLLAIPEPIRVVVNLRPCVDASDIDFKSTLLQRSMDARGKRQLAEIQETQNRMTYGEKLIWTGFHVFVRNVGCSLQGLREKNVARQIANQLQTKTGIPLITENYAAPAVFFLSFPLAYRPDSGVFTQRERRVLSASLGPYLPLFGGFGGTRTKAQLMLSRAGDPIYLCSRDAETSPHLAVLASSGGGKSFWLANYLCGEKALFPDSLDFIIDNKTSYEVFAKVFGQEGGYILAKPPQTFPNVFLGQADEDRVSMIVSILCTGITLTSPTADLNAEHRVLLKLAVQKTFGDNYVDAGTEFSNGILAEKRTIGRVVVPRLSDVVDKLTEVCREFDFSPENATWLRAKLSPYYGQGQYAQIFDQDCLAEADPRTPSVTLYDLDGVSGDPILCTLTTQICISEILRQVKRRENQGRVGRLIIEEAGVLGAKSPELVLFVQDAWKTFRKLGYSCIGLTNEVDDYRFKPAPRTMWQISPNKVVLRMLHDEIEKACMEDKERGVPKLFPTQHIGDLIRSLSKKDGVYSQAFWWGDECRGTFTYAPTGYDYWLAASKPEEVIGTVERLAVDKFGGKSTSGEMKPDYYKALNWLAKNAPHGFRDRETNKVRAISDSEFAAIASQWTKGVVS